MAHRPGNKAQDATKSAPCPFCKSGFVWVDTPAGKTQEKCPRCGGSGKASPVTTK